MPGQTSAFLFVSLLFSIYLGKNSGSTEKWWESTSLVSRKQEIQLFWWAQLWWIITLWGKSHIAEKASVTTKLLMPQWTRLPSALHSLLATTYCKIFTVGWNLLPVLDLAVCLSLASSAFAAVACWAQRGWVLVTSFPRSCCWVLIRRVPSFSPALSCLLQTLG